MKGLERTWKDLKGPGRTWKDLTELERTWKNWMKCKILKSVTEDRRQTDGVTDKASIREACASKKTLSQTLFDFGTCLLSHWDCLTETTSLRQPHCVSIIAAVLFRLSHWVTKAARLRLPIIKFTCPYWGVLIEASSSSLMCPHGGLLIEVPLRWCLNWDTLIEANLPF